MSKRRQQAPEFKAKVALEALKRRGLEGPSRPWRGVSPNNAAERALRAVALGRRSLALRRLGARLRPRSIHIFPDRHRQAERRRSSGVARGCPCQTTRHDDFSGAGSAAMELVSNSAKDGRMTLIARLRIILNDVDPQPMRHNEVPLKIRFDLLHEVIRRPWAGPTPIFTSSGWGMPVGASPIRTGSTTAPWTRRR